MLQYWAHSRNRPSATDEKSLLYFGCDFSGWYNNNNNNNNNDRLTAFDPGQPG